MTEKKMFGLYLSEEENEVVRKYVYIDKRNSKNAFFIELLRFRDSLDSMSQLYGKSLEEIEDTIRELLGQQ